MESRPKNLIEVLQRAAGITGKGITFIGDNGDTMLTYGEIYREAKMFLGYLQSQGMSDGDELIFQVDDNKSFVTAFWGCILGGIVPVPVKLGANDEEKMKLFKIWRILRKPYMLTNEKGAEKLEVFGTKNGQQETLAEIKEKTILLSQVVYVNEGNIIEIKPIKTGFIQFSSGSTGDPKGVVLSHENLVTNISGISEGVGIKASDSSLGWMPLTHDMGLIMLHMTNVYACIDQYIIPTSIFVRNPIMWMRKASEYRATLLSSPNFGYKHFLNFFKGGNGEQWDLSAVRLIYNGAEPISHQLCNEFIDVMGKYGMKKNVMFPAYGLAEACVVVTLTVPGQKIVVHSLNRNHLKCGEHIKTVEMNDPRALTFVDCGYAIRGTQVRIAGDDGNPLPDEHIGNIQISGGNVMWGYYRNRAASEKAITEDGWAWTGDMGFMREGRLVITGRAKDVLFVNGQNYYAHDIERVTEGVHGVELGMAAAAGIFNKERQEEDIVLFIRHKGKLEEFVDTKIALKRQINLQMGIKLHNVVPVKKMPKTTSGKVQRFKLRDEYINGEYAPELEKLRELVDSKMTVPDEDKPANYTQKALLHIWQDVLNRESISIRENFFEAGGDSLSAVFLVAEIHRIFDIDIQVSDIFEYNTIAEQSIFINGAKRKEYRSIKKWSDSVYYPMSSAQKRMYVLDKIDSTGTGYNNPAMLIVKGKVDKMKLARVIRKLIKRHETLRTGFEIVDGEPVQRVYRFAELPKPEIYFKEGGLFVPELEMAQFIRPFDLAKPPLLRAELISYNDERHILLFDMHHIITDGTSLGILIKELNKLYKGKELPELRIQYKDFTMWQRDFLASQEAKHQEQYWLNRFSKEVPVLNMPCDFIRPAEQSFEGAKIRERMTIEESEKLKKLAADNNATLYNILLAAYNALLYKYTGQNEIIVGTPVAGRNHSDLHRQVGVFINTLAMKNNPSGNMRFVDFLKQVKENSVEAFANGDYPFELLVEKLKIKRDISRNPLFDTMFSLLNTDIPDIEADDAVFTEFEYDREISLFDFSMEAEEDDKGLKFSLDYCKKLFKRDSMYRFMDHYINLLRNILSAPDEVIDNLDIMDEKEKNKVLYEFNNTNWEYPRDKTIHELFEEQAERTPDNTAVVFGDVEVTYRELNERANVLAHRMRESGIKPDGIAAIMMERSIEMITAIIAVLKAGGAYLPIDPEYPHDRIVYMLEDSKAGVLITDKGIEEKYEGYRGTVIFPSEYRESRERVNLAKTVESSNLAYVIYTSGSTGKPKGVMIEHRSVVNFLYGMKKGIQMEKVNSVLCLTTISFDIFVLEAYLPLICGKKMVLASTEEQLEPQKLGELMEKNKIDLMQATPSRYSVMFDYEQTKRLMAKIKYILTGGEALGNTLAKKMLSLNEPKILNMYGPTETTVWSSYEEIKSEESILIGKPIINTQMYIIDSKGRPVPIGIPGELCIGGDGLARGYFNNEALTNERFVLNPYISQNKMYKTGDIAKWTENGKIECLGRIDNQVKIRGHRIELGEIENIISKIDGIKSAAVIDRMDEGVKCLAAYYTGEEYGEKEIKKYISKELPDYMVPTLFMRVESIPLTPNGKIDRKKLPEIILTKKGENLVWEPSSDEERVLERAFKKVLKIGKITIDDDFFSMGGDSLNAMQIVAEVYSQGYMIEMKTILAEGSAKNSAKYMKKIVENREISNEMEEKYINVEEEEVEKVFDVLEDLFE